MCGDRTISAAIWVIGRWVGSSGSRPSSAAFSAEAVRCGASARDRLKPADAIAELV